MSFADGQEINKIANISIRQNLYEINITGIVTPDTISLYKNKDENKNEIKNENENENEKENGNDIENEIENEIETEIEN